MDDIESVYQSMCLAARQGGIIAKVFQGKVANEKKDMEMVVEGEGAQVRAMRTAKTVVDEAVQEIILLAAADCMDARHLLVDAEENTSSLALFPSTTSNTSLIIDPIDGTLEYTEGKDEYSVCIGIIESGKVVLTILFFPAHNVAYGIAANGKSYTYEQFAENGLAHGHEIQIPRSHTRLVYKTRRTPQKMVDLFTSAGFEVVGEETDARCFSYSEPLLRVLQGEAAGYIATSPQMRDVLIGPIIGNADGGFMCDWHGRELMWPVKGRIPESFFGNMAFEEEFRELLKGH